MRETPKLEETPTAVLQIIEGIFTVELSLQDELQGRCVPNISRKEEHGMYKPIQSLKFEILTTTPPSSPSKLCCRCRLNLDIGPVRCGNHFVLFN
jgi:hypothetical protein